MYISKKQKTSLEKYLHILHEVEARINIVDAAYASKYELAPLHVKELCYLQFRMICELFSLGMLIVHENYKLEVSAKLRRAYQADKIMKKVEALAPLFFPQTVTRSTNGNHHHIDANSVQGAATKKELLDIYHKSSEVLHAGTYLNYKKKRVISERSIKTINEIRDKLVLLLREHLIRLTDKEFAIASVSTRGGGPELTFFRIVGEDGLETHTINATVPSADYKAGLTPRFVPPA